MEKIRVFFEVFLFFSLTLFVYFLLVAALPVFQGPHGWLVAYEPFQVSKDVFLRNLLFSSAVACALLGSILIQWVPVLTPGFMANLWGATFFFLWVDPIFALCLEARSFRYIPIFVTGLGFLYFFFFTLYFLNVQDVKFPLSSDWKTEAVSQWFWGWMGFYFGLSGLMAWGSLQYLDGAFRLPLALGAMILCFLFYLLSLFLRKAENKEIERFSKIGRWVFTLWLAALLAVWIGGKWHV